MHPNFKIKAENFESNFKLGRKEPEKGEIRGNLLGTTRDPSNFQKIPRKIHKINYQPTTQKSIMIYR